MSVTGIGYVIHNKARVALERALGNPWERVLGVEWESILTFGFFAQGMGVGGKSEPRCSRPQSPGDTATSRSPVEKIVLILSVRAAH